MQVSGMKSSHINLLCILSQVEEFPYVQFRSENNPWRRESYFDGQMKWLAGKGLVLFTISRTVQLTDRGKEFVQTQLAKV